jgi:hypothetical protein
MVSVKQVAVPFHYSSRFAAKFSHALRRVIECLFLEPGFSLPLNIKTSRKTELKHKIMVIGEDEKLQIICK